MNQYAAHRILSLGAVALLALSTACGDSTTAPGGETEIISRVSLTVTPTGGGAPQTIYIDDPDGNGPTAPSAQVGALTLTRGVTYAGTVKFENRLVNPVEDITTEVLGEPNQHRVFYSVSSAGVTVTAMDADSQNRPLGVAFTKAVAANAATGAGTIGVVLCHYDSAPKVGSDTSCTGETDINVTFNISVAN